VNKVTGNGCANGGTPFCPNIYDKDLFCKNGNPVLLNDFAKYVIEGRKGCICKDGIAPRCRTTGNAIQCPDGSPIDWSLGKPGDFFDGCSNDTFKEFPRLPEAQLKPGLSIG
jgi:hypothetical protein